jgi:hypothetical protein
MRRVETHALGGLIEAWTLVIGAILSEPGDAAIDDARVDLAQAVIVDAEPRFDIGAKVLHHDVSFSVSRRKTSRPLGSFS